MILALGSRTFSLDITKYVLFRMREVPGSIPGSGPTKEFVIRSYFLMLLLYM